jgi:hypothetical protein
MEKLDVSMFAFILPIARVAANTAPEQDVKDLAERAVKILCEREKDYSLKAHQGVKIHRVRGADLFSTEFEKLSQALQRTHDR